jgi:hypothetical protein
MMLARLLFDLWRPVGLALITTAVAVLRDGRKTRTFEATLGQRARCTAVLLRIDPESAPRIAAASKPVLGPEAGRPVPPEVKAWSPFVTGVDTHVVEGDLLEPGPASGWFNLGRPLVAGDESSPFVHALSAADLAGGISAVVELRVRTFVDADLTVVLADAARAVDPAERGDDGGRSGDGRHTWRAVRRRQPVRRRHVDAHRRAPGRVPSVLMRQHFLRVPRG